ncbi:MAG: hypothetical protein M3350_02395 [Actinomycetota bacterium]|nr:hypothetical protein [Actinomycetota bacterium]
MIAAALASACFLVPAVCTPQDAQAARGMEIALQDDQAFVHQDYYKDRERALRAARSLGVTRIRILVNWAYTLSPAQSRAGSRPAVPAYSFRPYDEAIDAAARYGIRVHLALAGPAPAWATSNRKIGPRNPSPSAYGEWAGIAADHFKGRVDRYSIWNEPSWFTWLSPLRSAPRIYRNLFIKGYRAIKLRDRRARVLIGETVPYRQRGRSIAPLAFLRSMTCVNRSYRRRRCGGLKADGFAHHPYDFQRSPKSPRKGADNATIASLGNLTRGLDRLSRAGALRKAGGGRLPIYLTEHGYFSSGKRALPRRLRGRYLSQSFGIALKNRRVKSMLQYLLVSPPPGSDGRFFDIALMTTKNRKHPQFGALQSFYRNNKRKLKRPGRPIILPPRPS